MSTRREFVKIAAALAAQAKSGFSGPVPQFKTTPFTLGVASGDPLPGGVVLWTRLAPDPLHGGGMPPGDVPVSWQIYSDDQGRRVEAKGTALASAQLAHSVHVEVNGLKPGRWYWYRFFAGREESPMGRTRTAPPLDSAQPFRFAFASCQNYEQGFFTAYDHMSREDIDLVIHLGDYIYEKAEAKGRIRRHPPEVAVTLEQYRRRYAWYQRDELLQKAHRAFPWIVTPDDHEVSNNYAGLTDELNTPVATFRERRASAYQAYYEHMPLRAAALPHGADGRFYRRLRYGALAAMHVLDTRQYRSDQPCGDKVKPVCAGALSESQTMMGAEQEQWLQQGLAESGAKWNILAQQVLMAQVNWNPENKPALENMDKWDGYHAARDRLFRFLAAKKPANPIVISGDIHSNWVNDLKAEFHDPKSATLATEFAGTSISSGGDLPDKHGDSDKWLPNNPHVKLYNHQRGYVVCGVTAGKWQTDLRVVDYVSRPGAPLRTLATYMVEDGKPGAFQA